MEEWGRQGLRQGIARETTFSYVVEKAIKPCRVWRPRCDAEYIYWPSYSPCILRIQCPRVEYDQIRSCETAKHSKETEEEGILAVALVIGNGNVHVSICTRSVMLRHGLKRSDRASQVCMPKAKIRYTVSCDWCIAVGSPLALRYLRPDWVAPLGSSSLVFNFLFAYWLVGTRKFLSFLVTGRMGRADMAYFSCHHFWYKRNSSDYIGCHFNHRLFQYQSWTAAKS